MYSLLAEWIRWSWNQFHSRCNYSQLLQGLIAGRTLPPQLDLLHINNLHGRTVKAGAPQEFIVISSFYTLSTK